MHSQTVQKLIEIFSKFPTIGPRTAARFVFYLIGLKKEEINELMIGLSELKKNIKICSLCFNAYEGQGNICEICLNNSRDKSTLCVVEKETDLDSIEKTKKYRGRYFVLGGTISRLKKSDIEKLKIKELEARVGQDREIKEVIIAINPTSDGEATSLYLERLLRPSNKKITRLGRGLPVGGELEYADEETLSSALENRK
jgi:recombination protein RecR